MCGAAAGAGVGASVSSVLLATALASGLTIAALTQVFAQLSGKIYALIRYRVLVPCVGGQRANHHLNGCSYENTTDIVDYNDTRSRKQAHIHLHF